MQGISVRGPVEGRVREILTPEALAFVERLERAFRLRREALLRTRGVKQMLLSKGHAPAFLPDSGPIREGTWVVAPAPRDLQDRRVEITGPVERKMMINALNSGARVFMADLEDALSPTWPNVTEGQVNLRDAVRGELAFTTAEGKRYEVGPDPAVLVVRPRGWHLAEKHALVDGQPVSASLFDFGLHAFHNAAALRAKGSGPYYYLPKLEGALEARLWKDAFQAAEQDLGLPRGTIRCTVLIETLPAAFEMEEILYELREHITGLNAGRWDYLFSIIKQLRDQPAAMLPDRAQLTMGVPFMRAYCELLVQTCHKRGAHAIGGMAAFIPNRRDPQVTERALAKVREDKQREAGQGFDGTWVAHPDLVPVAREVFDAALGTQPHQLARRREDVRVAASDILDLRVPGGQVTEQGVRHNARIALQYTEAWLRGTGAVAIDNLMEDAATAEISRSQLWQWVRHGAPLDTGAPVTRELVVRLADEEQARLEALGDHPRLKEARALLDATALAPGFVDFLTIPAYNHLD